MKKTLLLFAALCCMMVAKAANPDATKVEYEAGKYMYFILDDASHTASVTWGGNEAYSGTADYVGDISVPSSITYAGVAYDVTSIGKNAFRKCTNLISVSLPEGLMRIEDKAFLDCTGYVGELVIPSTVASIGDYALNGFTGTITVKGSVKDVGESAFAGCTGLTSITVSGSIGRDAFAGCTGLTSITLKDGCILGDYALSGFTGTITVEGSVKDVGAGAFAGCTGLTSITVSGSIGADAFAGCTNLTSIALKDGCSLGDYALSGFTGTITVEGSVKDVGAGAFAGCTGLTSITVSGSIGAGAFAGCTNLTSITLKDGCSLGFEALNGVTGTITVEGSVKDVGARAFQGCTGLTSITVSGSIGADAFAGCTNLTSITLKDGCILGDEALNGVTGTITVEGSVKDVGESAFAGCTGLTSITVSGSIGAGAFAGCTNLTSITLKDGCSLGDDALKGVTGKIIFEGSVKDVGERAFQGCTGLTSITVSGSIGAGAFAGCTNLTSITLKDGCILGDDALNGFTGKIIFEGSVKDVGESAFAGCTGLTSITVSGSIGAGAFAGCTNLTSITLKDGCCLGGDALNGVTGTITAEGSVKDVGESAFEGCTGLTSITVSGSIGESAFQGCTGLISVTILNGVKSIGAGAFQGCTGLTSLTMPNSVESIGIDAFRGCTGLTSLTIPNSVTRIDKYAFWDCTGLKSIYAMPTTPPALGGYTGQDVFNGVPTDIPVYVPDVQTYFRSNWGTYFTWIVANMAYYKTKALEDIDAAMQEATLAEDEKAAVEAQVKIINDVADDAAVTDANIATVQNVRAEALAIINKDKCRAEKEAAISAITALLHGASDAYTAEMLHHQINAINAATTADEVSRAQDEATETLNSALAIVHSLLGTMVEKQAGPAVKVTDKDDNEIILYAPKKVEYIKINNK